MKRLVSGAVVVAIIVVASMGVTEAKGRPAGAGERGIREASSRMEGTEAATKISLTDILITGRPGVDPGGN